MATCGGTGAGGPGGTLAYGPPKPPRPPKPPPRRPPLPNPAPCVVGFVVGATGWALRLHTVAALRIVQVSNEYNVLFRITAPFKSVKRASNIYGAGLRWRAFSGKVRHAAQR